MIKKDIWSLVFYTIFAQMAVGAFLILVVALYFTKSTSDALRTSLPGLWVIFGLMVFSVTASLFHLGSPYKAYLSITNLGSSWLSAEILLTVFFTGGVGLLAVYLSTGFTPKPAPVLTTLTLIFIGLALIFAMSRVYMLRTVPTWNNLATPVSFYLTAFLAGSLVAVFIILHNEMDSLFILLNFSLVILIIQLLAVVFIRKAMWTGESVIRNYRFLFGLRSGLLGITVLALSLLRIINNPGFDLVTAVLLASILMVSASEIIGRFLFYMSYRRIGV